MTSFEFLSKFSRLLEKALAEIDPTPRDLCRSDCDSLSLILGGMTVQATVLKDNALLTPELESRFEELKSRLNSLLRHSLETEIDFAPKKSELLN